MNQVPTEAEQEPLLLRQMKIGKSWLPGSLLAFAAAALLAFAAAAQAQSGNQSSATNPYYGSVAPVPATDSVLPLTLDDAIRLGLEHNLALTLARDQQQTASGQRLEALNALLPDIDAQGQNGVHEYNLAAEGFRASLLSQFKGITLTGPISFTPTVTVTQAEVNLRQTLVSVPALERYRSAKEGETAAFYNMQSSRGLVVLNVATAYLQALAADAQLGYARELLKTDEVALNQAVAEHEAGTAARLDELRARVEYQSQQQAVIAQQNSFEKAKIALEREIGLSVEQKIQLADTSPYAELEATTVDQAKQEAYANRQDYQSMLHQIREGQLSLGAAKYERLPKLSFGGFYGVQGISGGIYHGVFAAQGELEVPLFQEARFRGDRQAASAALDGLYSQMADLKAKIDQQLRDSLLDLATQGKLVQVARSSLDLAGTALDQATERYRAGIDDNLPLVQAQSELASAQARYVNTVYNYNQAKLGLARNLGIIDTQYAAYLKGAPPAGAAPLPAP
jgi:outer membrane protein TolC